MRHFPQWIFGQILALPYSFVVAFIGSPDDTTRFALLFVGSYLFATLINTFICHYAP